MKQIGYDVTILKSKNGIPETVHLKYEGVMVELKHVKSAHLHFEPENYMVLELRLYVANIDTKELPELRVKDMDADALRDGIVKSKESSDPCDNDGNGRDYG